MNAADTCEMKTTRCEDQTCAHCRCPRVRRAPKRDVMIPGMFLTALVWSHLPAGLRAQDQDSAAAAQEAAIAAAYEARDADRNGALSEEEFAAGGGDPAVLRRDFQVLDSDGNGAMTREEFLNVPYLVPLDLRGSIPDPVYALVAAGMQRIDESWSTWDTDGNDGLSPGEFTTSGIEKTVFGLHATVFGDWDGDANGMISRDDCRRLLEVAYGVRRSDGELIRLPSGRVVHFAHFQNLDQNKDDRLSREEFVPGNGNNEHAQAWFVRADANADEGVTLAEWRTDPDGAFDVVSMFLHLDTSLDGRVDRDETAVLPEFQKGVNKYTFSPFDTDRDGKLTLFEFGLLPEFNLVVAWHFTRRDHDGDGRLSFAEFQWGDGPAMTGLRGEYFRRLDVNQDDGLDLDEWTFHSSNPDVQFQATDINASKSLSLDEFAAVANRTSDVLKRDFKVLDLDADGELNHAEFLNVPYLVPIERRGTLPDPIVHLVEQSLQPITKGFAGWDRDGNQHLSRAEFQSAAFHRTLSGLEMTGFTDWDRDRDGRVSLADCRLLLEIAWGVRRIDGERLRTPSGGVVQWAHFQNVDQDKDDQLSREEFVKGNGGNDFAETWYKRADANSDGFVSFPEWRSDPGGTHDALAHFLSLDTDLDGQISFGELEATPDVTHLVNERSFPAFDADRDGGLSLPDYMLLPQFNLVVAWHFTRNDVDGDGRLSFAEFKWNDGPAMDALRSEYFRRFDVDHGGTLDLSEWSFALDVARAPRELVFQQRDTDDDGALSLDEVLGGLKRREVGENYDMGQETALARIEEAFRRADNNEDGALDLAEFSTDDGLEAIAPGASGMDRQAVRNRGLAEVLATEGPDLRMYCLIAFNVLLLVSVAIYAITKARRAE